MVSIFISLMPSCVAVSSPFACEDKPGTCHQGAVITSRTDGDCDCVFPQMLLEMESGGPVTPAARAARLQAPHGSPISLICSQHIKWFFSFPLWVQWQIPAKLWHCLALCFRWCSLLNRVMIHTSTPLLGQGSSLSLAAAVKWHQAHREEDRKKEKKSVLSLAFPFSSLENLNKSVFLGKMRYFLTSEHRNGARSHHPRVLGQAWLSSSQGPRSKRCAAPIHLRV